MKYININAQKNKKCHRFENFISLFQNAKRTLLFFSYTLLTLDSIKPIAQVMKKTNTSKKGSGSIDWLF